MSMSSFWYELPKEFDRMEVGRDPYVEDGYRCRLVLVGENELGDIKYSSIVGVGKIPVDAVISASQMYSDKIMRESMVVDHCSSTEHLQTDLMPHSGGE